MHVQKNCHLAALICMLVLVAKFAEADKCSVSTSQKIDCGHDGSTQETCEASGCCWQPVSPNPQNLPWCFYSSSPAGGNCPLNYSSTGSPFSDAEVKTMRGFFLDNINIQGSGAVVAAPDTNTPGGSYYYHWERDAALSMKTLLETADSVDDVLKEFHAYIQWVHHVQSENDPHGITVLAEPKYLIPNGSVYPGGWCRPQNDGPGLRSLALMAYANALIEKNSSMYQSYVGSEIWPLIRTDLDWQEKNWNTQGCDLWEEIRSTDFFWNRYTMRAALRQGSAFAKQQQDASRSAAYATAAASVEGTLSNHFSEGYVYEATNRKRDSAVVCAFNVGYLNDGVFSPTSKEVAGTISTLNDLFCEAFPINAKDTQAGVPGILYGRYNGDHYAGGNPWILLTSALAEQLYRGATEALKLNGKIDKDAFPIWKKVLNFEGSMETMSAKDLAAAFAGAADGVLMRVRKYVEGNGFHLNEQLDKETGAPMAAKDLTWSYAATLMAMKARAEFTSLDL